MTYKHLAEYYRFVNDQIEMSKLPVKAWKLGGSNYQSRAKLGVNEILFGPLYETEVYVEIEEVNGLVGCCVELEVAIRETRPGEFDWALCLEFPNPNKRGQDVIDIGDMVKNRCDAGSIWVSEALNAGSVYNLNDMNIRFRVGNSDWLTPDFSSLIQNPTKLYKEFKRLSKYYEVKIDPQQWVSTGGITPCVGIENASELVIETGGKTFAQIKLKN